MFIFDAKANKTFFWGSEGAYYYAKHRIIDRVRDIIMEAYDVTFDTFEYSSTYTTAIYTDVIFFFIQAFECKSMKLGSHISISVFFLYLNCTKTFS